MTRKEVTGIFKRFLITFACMLPALIGLGFLIRGKISDVVMIVIFVVIAGAGIAIEELIHFKLYQKRQKLKEEKQKEGTKDGK